MDVIKTFQAVVGLFFRRENEPRGVQDSPVSKTEFCVIVSQTGDDGLRDFTKLSPKAYNVNGHLVSHILEHNVSQTGSSMYKSTAAKRR